MLDLVLASCLVNILALGPSIFSLQVYDRVVFYAGLNTLTALCIAMVIVIVLDFCFKQLRSKLIQRAAVNVDVALGRKVLRKVLRSRLRTLESLPMQKWLSYFGDIESCRNVFGGQPLISIIDLPFVILFAVIIQIIAAPIAWVVWCVIPIAVFIALASSYSVRRAVNTEKEQRQARESTLTDYILSRTTVKSLGIHKWAEAQWSQKHAETIKMSNVRGRVSDSWQNVAAGLSMTVTTLVTTVGAIAIINQEMTLGGLIASNLLVGRIVQSLIGLVSSWRAISMFIEAARNLDELFESESERDTSSVKPSRTKGKIKIESATFSFSENEKPAVNNINITMGPSGVYGVIGKNGSGKTTLMKLIMGLYSPQSGRVLIDDADISQFGREELSSWIGFVSQDTRMFSGSLRDNLTVSHPNAKDEDILLACRLTGALDFITEMPDGFDTDIGEGGGRLSSGQRQRLALSRTLIKNPPIMILDEPSSNLDSQGTQALADLIQKLGKTRTVILVSHSTQLLQICQSILLMHDGSVLAAGPAADILKKTLA